MQLRMFKAKDCHSNLLLYTMPKLFKGSDGRFADLSLHSLCAGRLLCAPLVKHLKQLHVLQHTRLLIAFCMLPYRDWNQMCQVLDAFFFTLMFNDQQTYL